MAYEQKEGDIAVFIVKEKKNERGPDYTGKVLINGEIKDVSLWVKKSKTIICHDGDQYEIPVMLAGAVKPKFVPNYGEAKGAVTKAPKPKDDFEDEIPF